MFGWFRRAKPVLEEDGPRRIAEDLAAAEYEVVKKYVYVLYTIVNSLQDNYWTKELEGTPEVGMHNIIRMTRACLQKIHNEIEIAVAAKQANRMMHQ